MVYAALAQSIRPSVDSFVGVDKKIALGDRVSIININDLGTMRFPIKSTDGE